MESPNQACAFCADRYRKITDLQKSFARIRTYAAGSIEIPDNAHLSGFFSTTHSSSGKLPATASPGCIRPLGLAGNRYR